ncbi:hypothetical protein [Paenibacillus peoriae]|uniref:hypothetical protein n=1 Tax=Paenibacillus peoriae TaxID=59893 RepID=UPI00215AEA2E|nr:hypothetical protein [Paenibacillus peoriae]
MASEKTPNLGLNQIDRTSPKTTYFDLEKYLDQNWRAVDDFAGDVNDGVNAIKKRLDTTDRKAVTLEPGVQIVHAEKASPFSLTGLNGRTLVNLLGRMGNCETVSEWSSNVAIAIDSNNKTNGSSSFKITLGSVPATASASFLTTPGRKYIAIADVKSGNTSKVAISINGIAGAVGNEVTSGSVFAPSVVRFTTKDYFHIVTVTGTGASGNTFNMDSVRVYEISEADYTAVASYTPAQAAAKWPYVDSLMPVRNPYAIRYGENLLPSFYAWSAKQGTPTITDEKNVSVTIDNKIVHTMSPLVPGQKYTVSIQSGGATGRITVTDEPESAIIVEASGAGLLSATFTATGRAANIRLLGTSSTAVTMSNPMLNIGTTAKPFKPREDSMLALQTDLYADPVTGANADTVFERDGQYFKSKQWQSFKLDDTFTWVMPGSYTGYKVVGISGLPLAQAYNSLYVTKFDGKILSKNTAMTAADNAYFRNQPSKDAFDISISSVDSGWGDSYTPTADEIKAYFMGWRMRDQTTLGPYTSGVKAWGTLLSGGANNYTNTLPTTAAPDYKTPYQLVYQLATPTVEPIVSEGQLSFIEGDNQVEVGTGIVVRESAKPVPYDDNNVAANRWAINKLTGLIPNPLKNKPSKIFAVYGNGFSEPFNWGIASDNVNWYNNVYIDQLYAYGADKSYSVTYLMAATSPIVPFTGSYAANEKTLLADLVENVQQANTRLSVVENKKADKDNPAWLAPTLLNGWSSIIGGGGSTYAAGYYKDSSGVVHMRGWLNGGATAQATAIFKLPPGYRPSQRGLFICYDSSLAGTNLKTSAIVVNPDGTVSVDAVSGGNLSLYQVSYLAEQ